jgi:hypothetical protein
LNEAALRQKNRNSFKRIIASSSLGGVKRNRFVADAARGQRHCFSVSGIVGNSADFIVARACCTGNLNYPLPNTTEITFNGGMAETGNSTVFYPGSQASSTEILTMTDDGGDQEIEVLSGQGSSGYQGQHSLWFTITGCARAKGCTP